MGINHPCYSAKALRTHDPHNGGQNHLPARAYNFFMRNICIFCFTFFVLLTACQPAASSTPAPTVTATLTSPPATATLATLTPTPQPTATPIRLGPAPADFPSPLNPLTGLPVEDSLLLKIPALLVSISHFPATARPQAGLSFAPFVYEISITEGASRFLAAFYGQYPAPEVPLTGNCPVRQAPFVKTGPMIGNRVWLDTNEDGRQEVWEPGVGGVCVNLLDAATGTLLQQTSTDSNGYYGFYIAGGEYIVQFEKPAGWIFTAPNVGDESGDSDADATSGRTGSWSVASAASTNVLDVDAGLVAPPQAVRAAQTSKSLPLAQVGPVRSGRLVYADIGAFYQNSCLIYAFASEEVLVQLPKCAFVTHEVQGGGYMLALDQLKLIAEDHAKRKADTTFNYASNAFSEVPPPSSVPATMIKEYWALLNQSAWYYDGASQSYWRYVDDSTPKNAGILHPEVDRLTGRQLHVENVILIYADVDVISPTNLDIHLEQGDSGPAFLFRDGMKYDIRWSTKSTEYEKRTGQRRPMEFLNPDGAPAALRPGHTWVVVYTPWSSVVDAGAGAWALQYSPPAGAK